MLRGENIGYQPEPELLPEEEVVPDHSPLFELAALLSATHSQEFLEEASKIDTKAEGQRLVKEYSRFFSGLQDLLYDEWPKNSTFNNPLKGGVLEGANLLQLRLALEKGNVGQFFTEPGSVDIHMKNRLDEAHSGSTADVVEAQIGSGQKIAAKVLRFNDLNYLASFVKQVVSLATASELGVGPKFYGFTEYEGRPVLLMEKIVGYEVEPKDGSDPASKYIKENSLNSFKKKMNVLHDNGLCFSGDDGQYLVGRDGEVFFMDITLSGYQAGDEKQKKEYLERLADFVYPRVTIETLVNMPRDLVEGLKEVCGNDIIDNLLKLIKKGTEIGLLNGGIQFLQEELSSLNFRGVPNDYTRNFSLERVVTEALNHVKESVDLVVERLKGVVHKIQKDLPRVPKDQVDGHNRAIGVLSNYFDNTLNLPLLLSDTEWVKYIKDFMSDPSVLKSFDEACETILASTMSEKNSVRSQEKREVGEKEKEQKLSDAENFVNNLTLLTDVMDNLQVEGLRGLSKIKEWAQGWGGILKSGGDIFESYIDEFEEGRVKIKSSLKNDYTKLQREIESAGLNSNQKNTALSALNKIAT